MLQKEKVPVGTMDHSLDNNYISVFRRRQTQACIHSFRACEKHLSAPLSTLSLSCQLCPFLGAAVQDHKDY